MSDLDTAQSRIAEALEGMIVVDAGPGTGKTHTIVERYVNLISRPDVSPNDVLLLTFTNNAAAEMEERIKNRMTELGKEKDSKLVQTKTFDAFCLSVVLDSSDLISDFFGISDKLTRSAVLQENQILNNDHFIRFLDEFLMNRGSDYEGICEIASEHPLDIMALIYNLMSRGLIPKKEGWFGNNWERILEGDLERLSVLLNDHNTLGNRGSCPLFSEINKIPEDMICEAPARGEDMRMKPEDIRSAVNGNRSVLFRFIHDVYLAYISRSISDNRLTFGLVAMFAFTVLYSNRSVREMNSFRYLMVDEFQDTNANQMMISMMILSEPNLCVVGDWKQGIYGFRYVSIENITDFEAKAVEFRRFLNRGSEDRVRFQIPQVQKYPLDRNYRSSQQIIDTAYDCLYLKATANDDVGREKLEKDITPIFQTRDDIGDNTAIRYVRSITKDEEVEDTIRAIKDYVGSPEYVYRDKQTTRHIGFGDISVICRTTRHCRMIREACEDAGIPAYLQGEVEIMSTREGKLALAWLRFVNNERDPWAYVPIMADMDYTPVQIREAKDNVSKIPAILMEQRDALYLKRRRITDLLASIFRFYNLDNDITQAIITTMSSIHRGSLLTISDVIRIIEDDILNESTYPVENFIDSRAVTIMTMHKSKGLEFPVVICPFLDRAIIPSSRSDTGSFRFDQTAGVRCTMEVGRFGDYSKICTDWRTRLALAFLDKDYSEERRLMFVAMSRAKQYETLICGPNESMFMSQLSGGEYVSIPEVPLDASKLAEEYLDIPEVPPYEKNRTKIGVHEILHFDNGDGTGSAEGYDEVPGKGMEYGTEIHKIAERMAYGKAIKEDYPEVAEIQKVLDRFEGCDMLQPEIDCGLPVDEKGVTLRGVIDLLVYWDDRMEIHDYKTDVNDRFEKEYTVQLSVYYYAVSQYYGKPVECYIDYVSLGKTVQITPVGMDEIISRVQQYMGDNI